MVFAIRRGSRKSYLACRSSFFCDSRPESLFLRLELSRGTTIAAVTGQAVVDLKLEVKWELVLTHISLP